MREKNTKEELFGIIGSKLSPDLTYHGIHHTVDVHSVCMSYIDHYNIDDKSAELLRVAAVGHDIGFTETYADHEKVGAEITKTVMEKHGYTATDIEVVINLILATKIPQSPRSFLAQIICDADLDYLGRDDFKPIGDTLKTEWKSYNIVPDIENNFDDIQIGFLKSHFYHTDYAAQHRTPKKMENLQRLIEMQGKENPARVD